MDASDSPTIQLDQFLKLKGIAGTGGQAKILVQGGEVQVNGEVEMRRGRTLRIGDRVTCADQEFTVTLSQIRPGGT